MPQRNMEKLPQSVKDLSICGECMRVCPIPAIPRRMPEGLQSIVDAWRF